MSTAAAYVVEWLSSFVIIRLLTYALVRWDRKRLSPVQRRRAWNAASTGAAIFFWAPLCIVAHYWVTRRSLRGIALGGLALLVLLLALGISVNALHWLVLLVTR